MTCEYKNYQELQNNPQENVHYRIETNNRNGQILIFTPHGGGIEPGTSELVKAIAGEDFSYYIFEGTGRDCKKMHITSTNFDEPRCLEMVARFQTSLAIHGFDESEPLIYAGGRDINLTEKFVHGLEKRGYSICYGSNDYAGSYLTNICNRTYTNKGVQLELSCGLRSTFFENWYTRRGRLATTPIFIDFVSAIRAILQESP